jgi:hypothetical protein
MPNNQPEAFSKEEQEFVASLYQCPEQRKIYQALKDSGLPVKGEWNGSTLCFYISNPATGEPVITLTTDYENNVFPQRGWSLFKPEKG